MENSVKKKFRIEIKTKEFEKARELTLSELEQLKRYLDYQLKDFSNGINDKILLDDNISISKRIVIKVVGYAAISIEQKDAVKMIALINEVLINEVLIEHPMSKKEESK